MAFFDLPLETLQTYNPDIPEPPDFDAFWGGTLAAARSHALNAVFKPFDAGLKTLETYDVTFAGYDGQPVKGWLQFPAGAKGPLPGIAEFIGYGGGRGFPTDWLLWPSAGYAHLVMDTRGQGSGWLQGETPDFEDAASLPSYPGFMTRGILDPRLYYYRRVFTDAVRAVEALASHPKVDPRRLAATGSSQGGGITLAVAGLHPGLAVAMPDVPFLCHFQRAMQVTDAHPYQELVRYCMVHRDQEPAVMNTLGHFDGAHFAKRAKARALFSVGLMDEVCPPSTIYAAYNRWGGPKEIRVWPYNHHEGGGNFQAQEKLKYLSKIFVV